MKSRSAILLVTVLCTFHPVSTLAQWELNGTPLVNSDFAQYNSRIVSDGAGGAVVIWEDWRLDVSSDIFAQRIDAAGIVQWTADGVALCAAAENQTVPAIASDGAGGAIVAWADFRNATNYDIYVQRIDAAGVVRWNLDGVVLCATTHDAVDPVIVSDGAGGAIVAWADFRTESHYDVYARRVNASGAPQWTSNGVALCTSTRDQTFLSVVPDGAGGAIVAWTDFRSGVSNDIYMRRINSTGTALWTANGVAVCTAAGDQESPKIEVDGASGAIVTWQDYRSATNYDIYAQRVVAAGTVSWTANGVGLCTLASDQINPTITDDGAGGAIVAWSDFRSATSWDVYTQRINSTGTVQWTGNGVAVATDTRDEYATSLVGDGASGAIVAWDLVIGGTMDIMGQRVDALGAIQWTPGGIPICAANGAQYDTRLVSDGAGGAVAAWQDDRWGDTDVYAQRVDATGTIPTPVGRGNLPAFTVRDPYPNPFGETTTIEFDLSTRANVTVEMFDVAGRRVAARRLGELQGWHAVRVDALDGHGRKLAGGVYFVRVAADGQRVTRKVVIVR